MTRISWLFYVALPLFVLGAAGAEAFGGLWGILALAGVVLAVAGGAHQTELSLPKDKFWVRCVVCRKWSIYGRPDGSNREETLAAVAEGRYNIRNTCYFCGANMTRSIEATKVFKEWQATAAHNQVHAERVKMTQDGDGK